MSFRSKTISVNNLKDLTSLIRNYDTIYIKTGYYLINNPIWNEILDHDITIIGIGKVTIECRTQFAYFKAPKIVEKYSVKKIINSNTKAISIPISNAKIKESSINAFLISDGIIETAWKYKKGELLNVVGYQSGNIVFKDSTFFDYNPNQNVMLSIFTPRKITLENITFRFNKNTKWDGQMPIRIDGCNVKLNKVKAINHNGKHKGWFMGMYYCSNINLENISLDNFFYGFVLNYSKDVKAKNILANNVTHPIVPATFTKNVLVDGMKGRNISTDAHLAINVHYKNVDINIGKGLFNCRAFGVKMTNCKFISSEMGEKPVTYLGVGSLVEDYKYLYNEYDVILENVEWVHKTKWLNGLHVNRCRNFVVDNCRTHSVTTGHFLNSFIVKNSTIGYLQSYDTNFSIINTTFDAKLQGLKEPRSPISCSWSGTAQIENCNFYGYKNNYLFGYVHSPTSSITIRNSNLHKLKGFVKKYGDDKKEYQFINFENCTIDKIEEVPKQLERQKSQILRNNTIKKMKSISQ